MRLQILQGDTRIILNKLPEKSVNCVVTSPPYYGLRDYGIDNQLGLEDSPELYIGSLVEVFRRIKRVLKDDGTVWLNLGDSYAGSGKGSNVDGSPNISSLKSKQGTNKGSINGKLLPQKAYNINLKPKDLIGIPWRVAFALQADGWYLRQDIIWHKPNPMPESVTDRCTKSHEYIFLLSKSERYYYDIDSIKEKSLTLDKSNRNRDESKLNNCPGRTKMAGLKTNNYELKNKRSVWTIPTKPYKEAHFATYPPELITPCILAGCPKDGVVLDPFNGSGTTGEVALNNGRKYIGIELNPEYVKLTEKRLQHIVDQGVLF